MIKDKGIARVLALSSKAPTPPEEHINSLRVLYSQNGGKVSRRKVSKGIINIFIYLYFHYY